MKRNPARAVLLIIIGLAGLSVCTFELVQGIRSLYWPNTTGVILKAHVEHFGTRNRDNMYGPNISYEYMVGVKNYEGQCVYFGEYKGSASAAQEIVSKYPAGAKVKVYYCPSKPQIAVLESGVHSRIIGIPLSALLLFIGIWWKQRC
jgi:hypothetical protein